MGDGVMDLRKQSSAYVGMQLFLIKMVHPYVWQSGRKLRQAGWHRRMSIFRPVPAAFYSAAGQVSSRLQGVPGHRLSFSAKAHQRKEGIEQWQTRKFPTRSISTKTRCLRAGIIGTLQPLKAEELAPIFCEELVAQELDETTPFIEIPQEIRDFYKMYRPSPLVRAYCLEEKLQTPAKIYYKFEGNNTSGSHKLNSAIAQAYYAKKQGLKGVTTETGAGQWGTALSMACSYFDLDCKVYMVKVSYEQKPFRREVMRTYGASVVPSPSETTEVGRKILAEHPGTTGSLGCAISEAVEVATKNPGYRYVLDRSGDQNRTG